MSEFEESEPVKEDQRRPAPRGMGDPFQGYGNAPEGTMSETVEIESTPVADQLGRLQAEAADWQDKYLRLYAELDNRKKRIGLRYVNQYEEEKEELLRDMLPLADNLERALANTSGDVTEAGLRRGVDITLEAFLNTLAKYGVKPIQAIGQPFDPNLHEAVGAIQKPDLPPGIVVRLLTKGYIIRDKLLRPAGVLITKE
jgi:molecular chaperone GrpE